MAKTFLEANQFEKAEKELIVAQSLQQTDSLTGSSKVLGVNNILKKLWQEKHYSDPKDIKKLISGWEKVLEKYPNYRDGYLQLAYFYYKLGEDKKAKENLKKSLGLDPNNEKIKELKRIIF